MKRLAAAALLLVACERRSATVSADAAAPLDAATLPKEAVASVTADASASGSTPPAPVDPCGGWTTLTPTAAKSIGHTSVVFKLEANGAKAAWKPSSKRGKDRWRGEIAAYRLAVALGIPNVPPACPKTIDISVLKPLLPAGALDEVIAELPPAIDGAVIPWIDGLQFLDPEMDPARKEKLAAQLSTLVVFDAITGNWDRYSGGNIGLDASGERVLFIDNDAAFMEGAPPKALAQSLRRIDATPRFSRSFIAAVRTLDVTRAFGALPNGMPVISRAMENIVRERIANVLRRIDARDKAETLSLP